MTDARARIAELAGADAVDVLALLGCEPVAARLITPRPSRHSPRVSLQVELADGRRVKLRRMRDEPKAAAVVSILQALADDRLAPLLHAAGDVLIEAWIEGTPLDETDDAELIERAGALLGSLHARPRLGRRALPECRPTTPALERIADRLGRLADAGLASVDLTDAALDLAHRLAPDSAPVGVIHRDFCGENLVLDVHGELRSVDNESLRIGPLPYDLGRTWSRWPAARAHWERFLDGYRAQAPTDDAPGHVHFWRVVATVKSADKRRFWERPVESLVARLAELVASCPV